jgi:hypothetical protein
VGGDTPGSWVGDQQAGNLDDVGCFSLVVSSYAQQEQRACSLEQGHMGGCILRSVIRNLTRETRHCARAAFNERK